MGELLDVEFRLSKSLSFIFLAQLKIAYLTALDELTEPQMLTHLKLSACQKMSVSVN